MIKGAVGLLTDLLGKIQELTSTTPGKIVAIGTAMAGIYKIVNTAKNGNAGRIKKGSNTTSTVYS